jgi:hypothetical protein
MKCRSPASSAERRSRRLLPPTAGGVPASDSVVKLALGFLCCLAARKFYGRDARGSNRKPSESVAEAKDQRRRLHGVAIKTGGKSTKQHDRLAWGLATALLIGSSATAWAAELDGNALLKADQNPNDWVMYHGTYNTIPGKA